MSQSWRVARVSIVFLGALPAFLKFNRRLDIDWRVSILMAGTIAVTIFGWLFLMRRIGRIDYPPRIGFDGPILPMTKYPIAFWAVTSYSMLICGGASIIAGLLFANDKVQFGILCLFIGGAILASIWLHIWVFSGEKP